MGYQVSAAAEFEFFLFEETPQSVRDKGYRQLKTMTPGNFGYSVLRSSVQSEVYHELLELAQVMRFPIEGLHTETGPGVLEAALTYCDALEAADRAALFQTFTKVLAQRHGLMATFMAKWSNSVPGQSGHLHISMRGANGELDTGVLGADLGNLGIRKPYDRTARHRGWPHESASRVPNRRCRH
jgi:glutamine synthetase